MTRPVYIATVERDGSWWMISVEGVEFGYTQARRLDQVEAVTRDMLGGVLETPADSFDLDVRIVLPVDVQEKVDRVRRLQAAAAKAAAAATAANRATARELAASGMPIRDVGNVMGVSYQRAQQLAGPRRSTAARAAG